MAKFIPIILPQPGDDLKAWARQLTSQLQFLGQQLQSVLSTIEQGGGASTGAITPITTPGGVTILDSNGYYIDGLGRVVVDATGLHVYDLVGFQVIDGPNVYINTEQLVDNAVETAKLAAGAVTEVKIDDDAITAPKIQAGAIVAGKLAANAIVANDGVIGTAAIADAQIANLNANKINAGSIAAERMEANIVTALNGKFATLSALASSLGVVQILSGGALFTQGATAYATGTGVWMGQDGGVYKWRAGNPAGARIQWTGSALEVYNSSNQLTIASGNVDWAGITGAGKPANNATVGATFGDYNGVGRNISGTITPGNVTTYIASAAIGTAQIANAAIGNAQIGGDIYSSTWDWSNGWLLQRNGNLYCANAYVRGNVEASSLKANTLMVNRANIVNAAVDTLQIEGNAVTIPVHSRPPLVYVTAGGWTSLTTAWINAEGSTVSIFAAASVSTTTLVSAQNVSIRVLSPSGLQIGRNVISLRDGLYSPAVLITSSTEAGTYTLQIYKSGPTSTLSVEDISLFLIGTKR